MAHKNETISRRTALKATTGSLVVFGTGFASASPGDTVEVNVGFENATGKAMARDAADTVVREFSFSAMTMELPARAAERLQSHPAIRYVEENGTVHASGQTLPWGVDRVDADVIHPEGGTGRAADIAILDTGIDSDHPDLSGNVSSGESFVGSSWEDDNGHGTHCAGIAGAADNSWGVVGVTTNARLHAVKVLDSSGSGSWSDLAAGLEHVADQGWDVGSMSLGASSPSSTVQDACRYASDNGVFLVAAAGNEGPCTDCVGYPAAYSEVVAVSSTTSSDSLAYTSSQGADIELAAPGSSIYSTYKGGTYETLSGTSMATPHVAGAAGILMVNGFSAADARIRLRNTAEDIGLSSDEQGYGLLDVEAATAGIDLDKDPIATTGPVNVDAETQSAEMSVEVSDLGGANSATVHFEWGPQKDQELFPYTTPSTTISGPDTVTKTVYTPTDGEGYTFRAVVEASDGDTVYAPGFFWMPTDGGGIIPTPKGETTN
ncbi:peptidase S8/S53 subtilisin kexin sedolisin [Haladaptatus paucihalophilus DX253]|uniref:Subtilisin n=1 Tax=Haladaptatus paucihalophilus DX253 TaxID=797209 RepID=E7QTN4_HALPU|nr:S8 family peptidase [Haladaptatus paucihalophilus]EFW91963.1 peptidase S8/S53 subtilisin kexin sedolisin [Haladaptatus paucihalophilus DX253]SHK84129.1 subtilisin [Haladaptatus paucihalophilus DX253]